MRRDRKQILRSFEAWLDRVLAEEEPPEGLPSEILSRLSTESPHPTEGSCDLYSMWSQMTALVQEVKLQGRSFKQLSEAVAPVSDLVPRLVELEREAQTKARREVLEMFLDLRDRLVRGLETARKSLVRLEGLSPRGWRSKLLGRDSLRETARETAVALEKGYALSVDRLDEVLRQLEVTEIPCEGRPFDPRHMQAVDLAETNQVPEGTVVEVYRVGYEWKGQTFRLAQVKVSRSPAGPAAGEQESSASREHEARRPARLVIPRSVKGDGFSRHA